jgi:HSP20 family protein
VKVLLLGNLLTVRGERPEPVEQAGQVVHRAERARGAFEVGIPLPVPVNEERVTAEFELGVLTVRMARQAPVVGRQIPVQVTTGGSRGTPIHTGPGEPGVG